MAAAHHSKENNAMKINWLVISGALALSGAASALNATLAKSTTAEATIVRSGEIKAAGERNNTGALSDSVLRVVPIESKYNVGVAVVRRSQVGGRAPPDALVHDAVTEVYQVIEGEGVLVTGGMLQSAKPLTDDSVVREIGPSLQGTSIIGGTRHWVGPGDIVIIPPHTPHGFVEITTQRIVYTIVRIDPERVLDLRSKTH
ncbi:MAG: AraC family ligand binding domain-containing protein [Steroidobacteraceae bacterium]